MSTIAEPPKRLWYVGRLPDKRQPAVAIVGSRKPTAYGQDVAHRLAYELAQNGIVVVSGLALGIDAIAHRGALEAGGVTVAVMPCGLDRIYPYTHQKLANDITAAGGALVSEYPPGQDVYRVNFIARNRIVSGISDGVVVVEASAKSGTMHTASFALEQGKAVLAVPGNITSQTSQGCNNLIKSGARVVTGTADIIEELGLEKAYAQPKLPLGDSPQEQSVLALLANGERDGDMLQKKSGLTPALFGQTMTMLEISGKIRPLGANQWAVK